MQIGGEKFWEAGLWGRAGCGIGVNGDLCQSSFIQAFRR